MNVLKRLFSVKLTEHDKEIFQILHPGDIAIDCGANIGNVTEKMAKKDVIVYAFEPNLDAYNVLSKRFKSNNNVHCLNKGVWNKNSVAKLYLHSKSESNPIKWSTGSSLLKEKNNIQINHFNTVEVIDLAQFISELDRPVRLLKIDIEGAECDVLEKLIDTGIAKEITLIVVETHAEKIPALRDQLDALKKKIAQKGLTNIKLNWQ